MSDELLAFVSLARVASGRPTLADIGALAWSHLRQVMPGATMGLFTVDASGTTLAADYASGPGASIVAGLTMQIGKRVTGWAAASARSIVNAHAHLDVGRDPAGGLRYAVATPLIADGGVVGVPTPYAPDAFAEDRGRRLEMVAPHLAVAVRAALEDADGSQDRHMQTGLRVVARR